MPRTKKITAEAEEKREMMERYYHVLARLKRLRHTFDQLTETELISACIYEINATQEEYSFILSRLRALEENERTA